MYRRQIEYPKPLRETYLICLEIIDEMGARVLTEKTKNGYHILAQTQMTWLSYGEKVHIRIYPDWGFNTQIEITSRSMQVITWGRNKKNIRRILEELEKRKNAPDETICPTPAKCSYGT